MRHKRRLEVDADDKHCTAALVRAKCPVPDKSLRGAFSVPHGRHGQYLQSLSPPAYKVVRDLDGPFTLEARAAINEQYRPLRCTSYLLLANYRYFEGPTETDGIRIFFRRRTRWWMLRDQN